MNKIVSDFKELSREDTKIKIEDELQHKIISYTVYVCVI